MSGAGWVLGTWALLWIAGYVRWAKRHDEEAS